MDDLTLSPPDRCGYLGRTCLNVLVILTMLAVGKPLGAPAPVVLGMNSHCQSYSWRSLHS